MGILVVSHFRGHMVPPYFQNAKYVFSFQVSIHKEIFLLAVIVKYNPISWGKDITCVRKRKARTNISS
jgi:hypothetical protein